MLSLRECYRCWLHQWHLLLSIVAVLFSSTCSSSGPIRKTFYGKVEGYVYHGLKAEALIFLSIPYAKPPVGSLRFKKPQAPEPWNGTRPAKSEPNWCVQFWYPKTKISKRNQSEDCLYLNLLVPNRKKGSSLQKYPVLVWIHGGSYTVGGANMFPVDASVDQLVAQDMIVVYINYRLGPFGYLSLMQDYCAGNFGLADQAMALRWIQENIAYFDGDPKRVTLVGESAGAASVSLLSLSPKAQGLFAQAMVRSGSSLSPWAVRSRNTDLNSETMLLFLHCKRNITHPEKTMRCLRNQSIEAVQDAWYKIAVDDVQKISNKSHRPMHENHPFFAHTYFTPVVDSFLFEDSLIPTYPTELMRLKAHIPLMIGHTTWECMGYATWLAYGQKLGHLLPVDLIDYVIPSLAYRNAEQVKQVAFNEYVHPHWQTDESHMQNILIKVASDQNFVTPSAREAQLYSDNGVPVYAYKFDYWNQLLAEKFSAHGIKRMVGAGHGFDMVFLFRSAQVLDGDDWPLEFDHADTSISDLLLKTFTNFVKFGNPYRTESEEWPRFDATGTAQALHYCTNCTVAAFYGPEVYFWNRSIPLLESAELSCGYRFQAPSIQCDNSSVHLSTQVEFFKHAFFVSLACSLIFLLISSALVFLQFTRKL